MTDPVVPTPAPTPAPVPVGAAPVPGKGMTIAGIVFAFLIPLLGLILSIVALVRNRAAGQKIGANIAGIIISIVWPIILGIIISVAGIGVVNAACAGLEPGTYSDGNGTTITCN